MRTKKLIEECVSDAVIVDYEHLEPSINLPDPGDHHVMASAIKGRVDAIITHNLKDFPDAQRHRATLKKPPKTVGEYLDILAKQGLVQTVVRLLEFEHVL